ncbi:MAG: hypothetical protein AAB262_13650, partial [Elusimicrobiota bacterium]
EDEQGRRTGRLPSGEIVGNIPGTTEGGNVGYGTDAVSDEDTGEPGPESIDFVSDLPDGSYKLVLLPLATTAYYLHVRLEYKNVARSSNPRLNFAGLLTAGAAVGYEIDYAYGATTPAVLLKDVTFATLRRDLSSAAMLSLIGDPKFTAKLDKTLGKGEAAAAKGKKKEAVEKLRKFVRKLEKTFRGEKDDDRDEDDKDQDKKHEEKEQEKPPKRFVSELAFKSLKGDAETLIAALGGKPGDDHEGRGKGNDRDGGKEHDR